MIVENTLQHLFCVNDFSALLDTNNAHTFAGERKRFILRD